MSGRNYRERLRATAGTANERGAVVTEYTVMMAGLVIMVIAGLLFLGGSVAGSMSWTEWVATSPLQEADNAIEPHECKVGGWQDQYRDDGSGFSNQGDCIQYSNTAQ